VKDFSREDLLGILNEHWGYDDFRPCQEEIIRSVLSGRDTLGLMPTGGGKSITFQVPALLLEGLTVVVTPLVSLMKDQVDNLRDHKVRAAYLYSGMSRREEELVVERARYGKIKLLYLSPEKIASRGFVSKLASFPVDMIVADEAHCISQWGYDFRPLYLKIGDLRNMFPQVPILALTASATPEVAADIREKLHFRPGHSTFALSFERSNISYLLRQTEDKIGMMAKILNAVSGSAIVYARSRKKTQEYAEELCRMGFAADFYHAGLDPDDKSSRQNSWKNGTTRVIVATNAFGMGIDKPDVRLVLHIDLPSSLEEYYQEAGRAGRDGKPSYAVLILNKYDKGSLSRKLAAAFPKKDEIRRIYGLLGSFFNLAPGEGYDTSFEFSMEKFCETYKLFPETVVNVLSVLSHAGILEYIDEVSRRSRLMMTIRREELYSYPFSREQERLVQVILRKYTGIFSDYEFISEPALCRSCNLKEETVYQLLVGLRRAHVIDYIPKKNTPYIYYVTSNEEPKHILIPREAYEFRRERMKRRMEAMLRFAYADDCCRVRLMLEYFGEKGARDCGTCDWCRAMKASRKKDDNLSEEQLCRWILGEVNGRELGIGTLIEMSGYTDDNSRNMLAKCVRILAESGKIQMDGAIIRGVAR